MIWAYACTCQHVPREHGRITYLIRWPVKALELIYHAHVKWGNDLLIYLSAWWNTITVNVHSLKPKQTVVQSSYVGVGPFVDSKIIQSLH